ncbi:MAG TPA: hypothetical protein VM736_03555, partial [Gemmatimonadales bacterium]|nr:hypothetical protein [Gemmatimonadales bacterium]
MQVTWLKAIATLGALSGAVSCSKSGDTTSPLPAPSAIALVSGNNQSGAVGQALPQPLVVKVTTASGSAAPGVSVSFVAGAGGGHLSAAAAPTDAQ